MSRIHWCYAGAASVSWGQKCFPDLRGDQARRRLWEEIFRLCRADRTDGLAAWGRHDEILRNRAASLDALQIDRLRFRGPGTDLSVGLSDRSRFCGGSLSSQRGIRFAPNLPSEEVFTTPDWRRTRGRVRSTRDFHLNGIPVAGLEMEFECGEIQWFRADSGADAFLHHLEQARGGRRLGEVALVGIDSPVYQSGVLFGESLFDENAACHIGLGKAHLSGIADAHRLGAGDFESIGCNVESGIHTDIMISSEEVDVLAIDRRGAERGLLRQGKWVEFDTDTCS